MITDDRGSVDVAGQLERLATLHGAGAVTDDEYMAAKAAVLRLAWSNSSTAARHPAAAPSRSAAYSRPTGACVRVNASVVTKLADRGSFQSVGIVTDVEPFFRELLGCLGLEKGDRDA